MEGSEGLDGSEGLEGLEGVLLEGAPWRGPCDVCGADAVTSDAVEHRGWLLRLAECRHCGHRATQRHPGTPQRAALRVHSVATRRPEVDSAA